MLNIRESTWIFITEPTERLGITVWRKEIIFLSFQSPCISSPCQNNGTCAAHYEKNSYVCLCAKGYTGKYYETGKVLAFCNEKQYQIWIESIRSRVIHVTQTKPDKCSRKKNNKPSRSCLLFILSITSSYKAINPVCNSEAQSPPFFNWNRPMWCRVFGIYSGTPMVNIGKMY